MADMETCERCRKHIPGVNFVMHVAHCLRNTEICPICDEVIAKANSAEHFEEHHKKVQCELCEKEVESKGKLDEHAKSLCPRRMTECTFCELELALNELDEHETYCGSRTEKCEGCGRFVLVRDLTRHQCDSEVLLLPCEFCEELFPSGELVLHQADCPASNIDEGVTENIEDGGEELIDGILPQEGQEDGEENRNASSRTQEDQEEQSTENPDSEPVYDLPCEVCGELCPSDKLMEHQDECLLQHHMPQHDTSPSYGAENTEPASHDHPPPSSHAQGTSSEENTTHDPLLGHITMVTGDGIDHFGSMFGRRHNFPVGSPGFFDSHTDDPFNLLWNDMEQFENNRPIQRMYFS